MRWLFDSYLANGKHGDTHALNLHIKCLSWSLARRAAIHGGTVHLALWKGAPLLVKDSFWGEYEAGIITGSDSKVKRIVRYDVERLPNHSGEQNSLAIAIDPGVVVWERTKHKMLGIPFDNQDWVMGHQGTTVHGKSHGAPKPAVCHLSRYTQAFWEDGNLQEVAAGDGKVPLPCDETLEIGVCRQ